MKRNHYGNLEISYELNSGPSGEQIGTDGEKRKGQKMMAFLTDPYAFTKKIIGGKNKAVIWKVLQQKLTCFSIII